MSLTFAETCERYFACCLASEDASVTDLAIVLADLHAQVLRLPDGDAGEDVEVSDLDYQHTYQQIGKAFPQLGYYHSCMNRLAVFEEPLPGMGDAIDDLTDICMDLHEGCALWYMGYVAEAVWQWRFLYQHHWGAHLVAVQAVIHAALSETV